jgi:hypothetical protein
MRTQTQPPVKSFKPTSFITHVHLARITCDLLSTTYWQTQRALKAGFVRPRVYGVYMPTSMSETSAVFGQRGRTPEPTDLIFQSGSASFSKPSSTNRASFRPRRPIPYRLQPAAYLHLPAPRGGLRTFTKSLRIAAPVSK